MVSFWSSSYSNISSDNVGDEEAAAVTLKSNCGALLSRQYHIVLPSTFIAYILFQVAITQTESCKEQIIVAEWTKQVNVAIAGCFLLSAFHHFTIGVLLGNWYSKEIDMAYPRAVYGSAALVSLIAGISACIKISEDYKYVCRDAFGVATFPSQWPEWLAGNTLPALLDFS